jgi:hypothetical protein
VYIGYNFLKWVSSGIKSIFRFVVEEDEVVIATNRIGPLVTTVFFEGTYFRFRFLYNLFSMDNPLSYTVYATITTSEGITAKRQLYAEITVMNIATAQTIEFLKGTQVENRLEEILEDESKSVGIINVCTATTPSNENREKLSKLVGAYGLSLSSLEFGTVRIEPEKRQF